MQTLPSNVRGYRLVSKTPDELAHIPPVAAGAYLAAHSRGATWFSYLVTRFDPDWGLMLAPDTTPGAHTDTQQYVVVDAPQRAPAAVGQRVFVAVEGDERETALGWFVMAVVSDNADVLALRGYEK